MKVKGIITDWGGKYLYGNGKVTTDLIVKIGEKKYNRYHIDDIESFNLFWTNNDKLMNIPIYFTCDEDNHNVKFSNYFIRKNKLKKHR